MVESIRPGAASFPGKPRVANRLDRTSPDAAPAAPQSAPPRLSLAAALAQKGPPFDAERVASLKAAIASGEYRIDLTAVADAIVRFGGVARD
jgi:flagellar biosynthesis anti-sigma factor FlgM